MSSFGTMPSVLVDAAKWTLQPASITAILIAFGIGVILLYARPRLGRIWVTSVLLVYWFLSSPVGAGLLARSLSDGHQPLQRPEDAAGATAVVLLGGGTANVRAGGIGVTYVTQTSALRVIETARIYRLLGDPLVIVSGGVTDRTPGALPEADAYRAAMLALGVPPARIISESESRNTHDEAIILKRMLREQHIERFVIVTSPLHMRRSLAAFAAQALRPIPSPAPLYADAGRQPFLLLPNERSFNVGNGAVYEWFAQFYYWGNGWTRPAAADR